MDVKCDTRLLLGKGTYGSVYETDHKGVVCKTFNDDENGLDASLLMEIVVDFCLRNDPCVIHFKGFHIVENRPVIYMRRYLSDLETALTKYKDQFDFDTKKHVLYQIIQGLYGAHSKSIVHRDISLNNVLFDNSGDVVIIDWGVAFILNEVGENKLEGGIGKSGYRSPELLKGYDHYDTSIDMWAVGIIMGIMFSRGNLLVDDLSNRDHFVSVCINGDNMDSFVNLDQDPKGYDLLHHLLTIDPSRRIDATGALNHPFFSMYQERLASPILSSDTLISYPNIPIVPRWIGDITGTSRLILVDWMMDVCVKYRPSLNVLFHSVDYLDYYVSQTPTFRKQLQLLGVFCLLTASKIVSETPLEINDLTYIADGAFTKQELIDFEKSAIMVIKKRIYSPTPVTYLNVLKPAVYHKAIYNLCLMVRHLLYREYDSEMLAHIAMSDEDMQAYLGKIPENLQKINYPSDWKLRKYIKL